ncbi:MAG: glycosyltransferase [Roseburia sp.]|nr:glycosyltransferase [Roseburia sp.]
MSDLGRLLYQEAVLFFENGDYENAVLRFIGAYHESESREQIMQILYDCFITPNELEFEETYQRNQARYLNVSYEELSLDFIPVAENVYYIFDKEEQEFKGRVDCNKERISRKEEIADRFNDYLFGDTWDLREILPISLTNPQQTSVLISSDIRKTASFGKLPLFFENYMSNIRIFDCKEEFERCYREKTELYIPKQLIAGESGVNLQKSILDLHSYRTSHMDLSRDNIFLSVCIPSLNRGHKVLEAVSIFVDSIYDAEIEVIVSNNGSTKNREGYKAIEKMKDSRLVYHEFSENQGFLGNICKVLSMAKGKFAVLCSDEDRVLLENLPYYLDVLRSNPDIGMLMSRFWNYDSTWKDDDKEVINYISVDKYGLGGMFCAMTKNYITGTIYNTDIMRQENVLEKAMNCRENLYVQIYPHLFINMLMTCRHDYVISNIKLWHCGKSDDVPEEGYSAKFHTTSVFYGEKNRLEQFKAQLDLIDSQMQLSVSERIGTYLEICKNTLRLANVSYAYFESFYKEKGYSHESFLMEIRDFCISELMDRVGYLIAQEGKDEIEKILHECCQSYIDAIETMVIAQ